MRAFGLYVGQLASAEDLAALRIEDHEPAGLGAVRLDGGLQLAEREVLEPRVDREREVASRLRRADRLDVLDDLAAAVDDHAAAAGLAAEPLLLRELDALLPDVVVAGEAQDVAHRVARRIEAPVFVLVVDAFDLERRDAVGDLRRNLLREEDEVARRRRASARAPAASFRAPARAARACPASRRLGRETPRCDFTGVEIASGSPARSTMRPRCAGTSISRL